MEELGCTVKDKRQIRDIQVVEWRVSKKEDKGEGETTKDVRAGFSP